MKVGSWVSKLTSPPSIQPSASDLQPDNTLTYLWNYILLIYRMNLLFKFNKLIEHEQCKAGAFRHCNWLPQRRLCLSSKGCKIVWLWNGGGRFTLSSAATTTTKRGRFWCWNDGHSVVTFWPNATSPPAAATRNDDESGKLAIHVKFGIWGNERRVSAVRGQSCKF